DQRMTVEQEIAALKRLTTKQLKRRFAELTGDATAANNRPWLIKRLAWRLQALAHGGLSQKALDRAEELANDADLRLLPPREVTAQKPTTPSPAPQANSDTRLPPPGSVIARKYKGRDIRVTVLSSGFEWGGKSYPSLSAVAKA